MYNMTAPHPNVMTSPRSTYGRNGNRLLLPASFYAMPIPMHTSSTLTLSITIRKSKLQYLRLYLLVHVLSLIQLLCAVMQLLQWHRRKVRLPQRRRVRLPQRRHRANSNQLLHLHLLSCDHAHHLGHMLRHPLHWWLLHCNRGHHSHELQHLHRLHPLSHMHEHLRPPHNNADAHCHPVLMLSLRPLQLPQSHCLLPSRNASLKTHPQTQIPLDRSRASPLNRYAASIAILFTPLMLSVTRSRLHQKNPGPVLPLNRAIGMYGLHHNRYRCRSFSRQSQTHELRIHLA